MADLFLESGPRRKTTMVHVLDLLGCVATGPTTEAALAATPEAIRAYRRFLCRWGEAVDPEAPVEPRIVEHITEGAWLGNGSPYVLFGPDLLTPTPAEVERCVRRFHGLREELAGWAERQTDALLDAAPIGGGRTGRAVLLHCLGSTGGTLSAALGAAPGFSALHGAAERGQVPLAVALRRQAEMVAERLRAVPPEQWASVRELPGGRRTPRQGLRLLLEHEWNHLAELARRPGGPVL